MKKAIILTTLLASTALAQDANIYVRANAHAANLHAIDNFSTLDKLKRLKPSPIYCFSGGVGVHLNETLRVDLTYERFKSTTHTGITGLRDHKIRGQVNTAAFNGYIDLFNTKPVTIFVGGGIGLSQIGGSHIFTNKSYNYFTGIEYKESPIKARYKNVMNVSYAFHAGIGVKLNSNLTSELYYSYKDLGKTTENSAIKANTLHYRGHYTGIGLRLDI